MTQGTDLDPPSVAHDKILLTAARLFSERGYDKTSISQVAREARVSKALIFWHFENKETLFRAALRRTLEPYFININDLEGLNEWAQVDRLIDLFYEFVHENAYSVRFFLTLILRGERNPDEVIGHVSELYRLFRSLLAAVIEKGRRESSRFRADVEPSLEASLILAALGGIVIGHFTSDGSDYDPSQLVAHLKRTLRERLQAQLTSTSGHQSGPG